MIFVGFAQKHCVSDLLYSNSDYKSVLECSYKCISSTEASEGHVEYS